MAKLEEIELTIDDEKVHGTFAMSVVSAPAMEADFVYLNANQLELKVIDEERRIVVGFAMIPEKRIYRKMEIEGEEKEFNIYFSKETVAKSAELFMKNLHLNNFTDEHQKPIVDCSVIECWVVEDAKNDKSNIYGLKPSGGEWVLMSKIENDDEWNLIKEGKRKGYSLEGIYSGFENLKASKTEEEILIEELSKIIENEQR